jgi:hypothetical protein
MICPTEVSYPTMGHHRYQPCRHEGFPTCRYQAVYACYRGDGRHLDAVSDTEERIDRDYCGHTLNATRHPQMDGSFASGFFGSVLGGLSNVV